MKLPIRIKQKKIKIGTTYIGENNPVFFIAEIGINHNGDLNMAKKLMLEAKNSGANAVKFQKRNMGEIFTAKALDKVYESPNAYGKTYGDHRKALEFELNEYQELFRYAKELNILLFASVWDTESVKFMEQFSVDAYKIASADMNYYELIKKVARTGKPILISTGMATQDQIKAMIRFTRRHTSKSIIMHCTSVYPADDQEINLEFMRKIQKWSKGNPIGYSGHEIDWLPSFIATFNGANVIERHLTLDKSLKGSDHAASLTPNEFFELTQNVKRFDVIMGNGSKIVLADKVIESKKKLGKSIYTNKVISKGSKLSLNDLVIKTPGGGLDPNQIHLILNRRVKDEMNSEHQISLKDFD
jgi:sialic acid synthase SpsE